MPSRSHAVSRRVTPLSRSHSQENTQHFNVKLGPANVDLVLQFLYESHYFPSSRSLQLFGCFQPNVHLGLVFYNELYDIVFYWDSLTPVRRAISKHLFFLDYTDATEIPVLQAIFWEQGRTSHVVFPRPSPPTCKLLTLVNPEGRLRISIIPDGDHPKHYPHALHTDSVTHNTISWLESEFRKPSESHFQKEWAMLESLALAVYRIVMVSSAGGTIVSPGLEEPSLLGELVVQNSERPFWASNVQFRYYLPLSPSKSYKWTWHDDTTTSIYHGIPGWTRFTLRQKNRSWITQAATIVLGDEGDNVDNWDVLLACLKNWAGADADLRSFCLDRCSSNTQVGFVTQLDFTTYVHGIFTPLPGFDAADTVYLFIEDLRVEADGHVAPCGRYYSLDRTGATRMSAGLQTLYGVEQTNSWHVRKGVKYFDREHYAVLEELRTRVEKDGALGDFPGVWRDARSTLKRSRSATRLDTVDWRTDWMWEDHNRELAKAHKKRHLRWRQYIQKRRPELAVPVAEEPEEPEVLQKKPDLVRRLHRSKTKSVGGGLSLVFKRIMF
ncbi:hypothetical protein FB451DRAFT_1202385 [Mycena latifolia]|nr:hypothetical protein FB451DRAFT_1202385 [Mycena latifolia]